ncbi:MAG: DoxX family protein [Bdellovibrionales bacterium]
MKHVKTGARLLLGLAYVVFGMNFFLQFLPQPPSAEPMAKLMGAFFESGYLFPFIKLTEIIAGALLLTNLFVPLALVILAPITLNIVAVHAFLDPSGLPVGALLLVLHVFLGLQYLSHYKPMLTAKA